MKAVCHELISLIQDEEIGIHEYLRFASKYANTGLVSTSDMEKTLGVIDDIVKEEFKHSLELIKLLPIFCKTEDLNEAEEEGIQQMEKYFLKENK